MPARALRHTRYLSTSSNAWQATISAIPAARALVGKVIVANATSSSFSFTLNIGTAVPTDAAGHIAANLVLAPGEVYTENIVLTAGESVYLHPNTATVGLAVNIMGEEVDN